MQTSVWQWRSLFFAVGLLVVGNGLQGTLLGLRGGLEGMSDQAVGIIMSANYLGFVAGSLYAPALIQRVGHIRAFAAFASAASAIALAFAVFVSEAAWSGFRAIHGACFAGLIIVVESWLNASSSRINRGRVLAAYMVVFYAAWAGSQPLINFAPVDGFVLFCLVSVCLSLALLPVTLTRAGVPGVVSATRLGLAQLYRISPLAVVGAFALGAVVGAFFGMAPLHGQAIGLNEARVSIVMTAALLGALILQWPVGWLSDRIDRRVVIIAVAAGSAIAAVSLALIGVEQFTGIVALTFLFGGMVMPIYSLCVARANDQVSADQVIALSSGLVMTYGAGSAAGPFLASLAMRAAGPPGLFWFIAVTTAVIALFGTVRLGFGATVAAKDKQDYVAVPQTSHAALPLHRHGSGIAEGDRAPQ